MAGPIPRPAPWHEVADGLWVGDGRERPDERFDLVVTMDDQVCAEAPVASADEHCWFIEDTRWEPVDMDGLREAVDVVVSALAAGRTVLVRCRQGVNRSALVAGCVLRELGLGGEAAIERLRTRRHPLLLSNPRFADTVRTWSD